MNSSGSSVSASMARATCEAVARVLRQPAPLLDDGARQRLGEAPLGQHHLDGLAAPGLAGEVLGDQRQLTFMPAQGWSPISWKLCPSACLG